jgi:hypothetical protein
MRSNFCHYLWQSPEVARNYTTAVSLHSHTLHSQENLRFVPTVAHRVPFLSYFLRKHEARYREYYGADLDFDRGWWTPPLSPREAWKTETRQIENVLRLAPLVALTDHDDIEAPMHLQVLPETRGVPVGLEWTVPYGDSYFHLGIHNLPARHAHQLLDELSTYTQCPSEPLLADLLDGLHSNPEILVVFNHPLWDEPCLGAAYHRSLVDRFLRRHRRWIHAIEVNGLRCWRENTGAMQLAAEYQMPLISGGDRHGCEPNGILNLTRAATFAEFSAEVRRGRSHILFMNQCAEPIRLRIMQGLLDVVREYNDLPEGRRRWTDRVFFRCEDGVVRRLSDVWTGDGPEVLRWFMILLRLLESGPVRGALRVALAERQEGIT